MNLTGLILAAGASRRMGTPKALLPIDGETFLDRLIAAFEPHCAPVLVVLGHDAETIRAGIRRGGDVRFVLNPNPERGQLSSLQCGLSEVPESSGGVVFTPVDYPRIKSSTIAALAAAFRDAPGEHAVVVPTFQGRRGHPVCIARQLIPDLLGLPQDSRAREIIHRNVHRTRYVEVDSAGILRDVDDPATYRQVVKQNTDP